MGRMKVEGGERDGFRMRGNMKDMERRTHRGRGDM